MNKKREMWALLRPLLQTSIDVGYDKEVIRTFCGVTLPTLESWLKPETHSLPIASPLLRLWFFFDVATEGLLPPLRDMSTENAQYVDLVARSVAFNVINLETALELCGLSGNKNHAWAPLRGESTPNKLPFTLQELEESYRSSLQEQEEKLKAEIEMSTQKPQKTASIETVDELLETILPKTESEKVEETVSGPEPEMKMEPVPVVEPKSDPDPEPDVESDSDRDTETDPEPEPATEPEPQNVVVLPEEAVDKLLAMRKAPEKALPVDILLSVAGSLSAVLPHIRHLVGQFEKELIEEWLSEYFGDEAAASIVEFLGYSLSPEETEDATPDIVETGDVVSRTAKALRQLAPDIDVLFKDDTSDGALARQRLRDEVGNELFSNLAVKVTALRSRRSYDKARNGDVN